MPKEQSHTKNLNGFSAVEIVLSLSIFAMLVLGLVGVLTYAIQANAVAGFRNKAVFLAQEGLEATRSIRDKGYANLADGTYGVGVTANAWALTGTNDTTEIFTRQVQVSTLSATSKQVRSTVSWTQLPAGSITFTEILTNWRRSVPIGDWATIIQNYGLNLSSTQDGWEIDVQGNYAYIIRNNTTANFLIVDISSATTPVLISTFNLNGRPYDVEVSGNYAYVASGSNTQELQIVNVTNPLAPTLAGSYNASGSLDAVSLSVYAANRVALTRLVNGSIDEFLILNTSTIATPVLMDGIDIGANANDVVVIGNYAYIGTNNSTTEIRVINISNPSNLTSAGSLNLTGSRVVNVLAIYNDNIVIGCADGSLFTANLTNPTSPVAEVSLSIGSAINDISVNTATSLVFLATSGTNNEFQVISGSSGVPVVRSTYNASGILYGLYYNTTTNQVYAVGASDTEEFIKISSN